MQFANFIIHLTCIAAQARAVDSKLVGVTILYCDVEKKFNDNEKWMPSRMLFVKIDDDKLRI